MEGKGNARSQSPGGFCLSLLGLLLIDTITPPHSTILHHYFINNYLSDKGVSGARKALFCYYLLLESEDMHAVLQSSGLGFAKRWDGTELYRSMRR
jgi:hypothetical protein